MEQWSGDSAKPDMQGPTGGGMEMHLSSNNQDIILDDELNIMLARYYKIKYIS